MLLRDSEGWKKEQARSYKQQIKATQHTQVAVTFPMYMYWFNPSSSDDEEAIKKREEAELMARLARKSERDRRRRKRRRKARRQRHLEKHGKKRFVV